MIRYSGPFRLLAIALIVLFFTGCGRFFTKDDPLESLPVEGMYAEARQSLETGNFSRAQRYYQRLIARFPYGTYTEQAQLEMAYAQFKGGRGEEAQSTISRFIRTYPAHDKVAYAYYLKALVNFEREDNVLDRIAKIDTTLRDQSALEQSFNDFAEVIRRFPDTRYAADARQRMVHIRNLMAQREIGVGTYYLRRGAYVAAAKRGEYVLEHYPQSGSQGDALALMVESYQQLGQDALAKDSRRVLELNHPEHPYLSGDWPSERGWWWRLIPLASERG